MSAAGRSVQRHAGALAGRINNDVSHPTCSAQPSDYELSPGGSMRLILIHCRQDVRDQIDTSMMKLTKLLR